jgi:MSHA biogenesis protein MshI
VLQGFKKGTSTRGRTAVTWRDGRAAVARASHRDQGKPLLQASLTNVNVDGSGEVSLGDLQLDGSALPKTPVSGVLADGSYRLLLEELPSAPRNEMRSAVGWRIKDRIETSLDDAVIELLEMPAQARGGSNPSAYAIVAKRDDIESQVAQLKAGGLKLDALDLPELCMRNLAVRLPQDREGVAFLHFTEESGLLTVTRQGVLYLIRRIDIGQLQLAEAGHTQIRVGLIPSICLELQRSLDYYEATYDLPSITTLVLGPGTGLEALKNAVNEQLGLNVINLDLGTIFELAEPLDEEAQKECLFAAGAALRPDAAKGWE